MIAFIFLLSLHGCSASSESAPAPSMAPVSTTASIDTTPLPDAFGQAVNVRGTNLRIRTKGVELEIPYLKAQLVPNGDFVDVGSPSSFEVEVQALEFRFPTQDIGRALATGVGKVRGLDVMTQEGAFAIEGKFGALRIPFGIQADPSVDDEGNLMLDMEKIKLLGINIAELVDAFDGAVEGSAPQVVRVEDETLFVDPFPTNRPPVVHAHFSSAKVDGDEFVARLGENPGPMALDSGLVVSGGALRSGGTLLMDSTMTLIAEDGGQLVIDAARFSEQQQAGFNKQLGPYALRSHLASPDSLEDGAAGD